MANTNHKQVRFFPFDHEYTIPLTKTTVNNKINIRNDNKQQHLSNNYYKGDETMINQTYDVNLSEFPREKSENSDEARIMRAIETCPSGVLFIPKGVYELKKPVVVTNCCSLLLHKSAVLKAVDKMNYVLIYDAAASYPNVSDSNSRLTSSGDYDAEDWNLFVCGGVLDGNGLASCMSLLSFKHFTMKDTSFRNGKQYGLRIEERGSLWSYELVATNLYFKCTMPGLGGNAAVSSLGGDSHFVDCICVDYTVGFELLGGGSNRLTRCHVWGGPIPPRAKGEPPEMLVNSVNYRINCKDTILTDCYADTGQTGFEISADSRLIGCSYYNNYVYGLDNIIIIQHFDGRLVVSNGYYRQTSPNAKLYVGGGDVIWRDNVLAGGLKLPE